CTLRTLFTIHNLEYQGTRPFAAMGELRGFLDWFPELAAMPHDHFTAGFDLYADIPCINPMRMAINLADFVTTVSPSYAEEICHADDPARDFFGGRGLEKDLERLHREGRLTGITNGIDLAFYDPQKLPLCYSAQNRSKGLKKNRKALYADLPELIPQLAESGMLYGECVPTLRQKIQKIKARDFYELPLLVVVSRMTGQKIRQFFAEVDGKTPLEHLATEKLFVVFLGKGDLLQALMRETASLPNILLFAGFDDMLEKRLLAAGDLFLMPSEFEPCGTSQMKAMRYGCLPVAHAVGGLKDTIRDGETGFLYTGNSLIEKAKAFWATIQKALALRAHRPKEFERMQENAMRSDFSWHGPALRYLELMQ
ncbi:MAG: glycogen/starch synthase, partial [Turneriella sp.]|nr:glycogen/starch synthase [Turneriella sp.]